MTCESTSDSTGSGTHVWKLNTQSVYVLFNIICVEIPCVYHLAKDIAVNCHRSGATSQTYPVPKSDNSASGSYTCMVTVSTVASPESSGFSLGVTGIVACHFTVLNMLGDGLSDTFKS